jgi:phosphatidylserine decarboxylase
MTKSGESPPEPAFAPYGQEVTIGECASTLISSVIRYKSAPPLVLKSLFITAHTRFFVGAKNTPSYNREHYMVRDGYYYAIAMVAAAVVLGGLTTWWVAPLPLLLAAFFLWFFRDPERAIPTAPGLILSPADGKVTDVVAFSDNGRELTRISIFLNVFNVHVNRTPIAGIIRDVKYNSGKFLDARHPECSELNEQNVVTLEGEGKTIIFKQIAGLLARRLVFTKRVGDAVSRGERIGMMKFGSRADVIFDRSASVRIKLGDHVIGGVTILAIHKSEEASDGRA